MLNKYLLSQTFTYSSKQRRKTTPANVLLTAPKPFKSLTNTYDSQHPHRPPLKNVAHEINMDYINGSSSRTKLNKNNISSSTLPSNMRHNHLQHGTGYSDTVHRKDARSKDSMLTTSQEMLSPSSEPPPILPRRYEFMIHLHEHSTCIC